MTSGPRTVVRTRIVQTIACLVPLTFLAACDSSPSSSVAGPSPPPQVAQPPPAGPPPVVTGVSPSMGVPGGGTMVQIVGTGLTSGARITFGGVPATLLGYSPAGDSFSVITARHPAGTVDVAVTTPYGQTGRLDAAFTYGAVAPVTIDSIAANAGPTAGGTYLTIRGTGFQRASQVVIDGAAARAYWMTSTQIFFTTLAHAAGTVELAVSTPDGQLAQLAGGFTFVPPAFSNFNGTWAGRLGDEGETAFSFTVRDDVLVSISCNTAALATTPSPSTSTGEFAVTGASGRSVMTGGLTRPDQAAGLISLVGCTTYDTAWVADRQ